MRHTSYISTAVPLVNNNNNNNNKMTTSTTHAHEPLHEGEERAVDGRGELLARRDDVVRGHDHVRLRRELLRRVRLRARTAAVVVVRDVERGVVERPPARFRGARRVYALHLGERVPDDGVQGPEGGERHGWWLASASVVVVVVVALVLDPSGYLRLG